MMGPPQHGSVLAGHCDMIRRVRPRWGGSLRGQIPIRAKKGVSCAGTDRTRRSAAKRTSIDKWAFGVTLTVVGVGGTFLTLAILIWSIQLLKKLMPLPAEDGDKSTQS